MANIEDILEKFVNFKSPRNPSWRRCYCEVCGDGSRTKGPRAGWLFKDDAAFYNCFNCGIDGSFDPSREVSLSKDMKKIFDSYGVPYKEYAFLGKKNVSKKTVKRTITQTKEIPIPKYFKPLTQADNEIAQSAKNFLSARQIDYSSYPFYVVDEIPKGLGPEDEANAKFTYGRLIIPAFYKNKMIYYQSRELQENASSKKYLSPKGIKKSNIFYFYDRIWEDLQSPLFICEGFFDAYHVKGIATMENDLSIEQQEILKRSNRKIVVIPDNKGDSNILLEKCLSMGFGVSCVDKSVKDITESIQKFGKLYTFYTIAKNVRYDNSAKIFSKMYWKI